MGKSTMLHVVHRMASQLSAMLLYPTCSMSFSPMSSTRTHSCGLDRVYVRVHACACVRACVRACARVCVSCFDGSVRAHVRQRHCAPEASCLPPG